MTSKEPALPVKTTKPKLEKVDLSDCLLETYQYPSNCNAAVLTEFTGGHRIRHDPSRALTKAEWLYLLKCALINGGREGVTYWAFSEMARQRKYNFSARALFKCLTEEYKCEGSKLELNSMTFYNVRLTASLYAAMIASRRKYYTYRRVPRPRTVLAHRSNTLMGDPTW